MSGTNMSLAEVRRRAAAGDVRFAGVLSRYEIESEQALANRIGKPKDEAIRGIPAHLSASTAISGRDPEKAPCATPTAGEAISAFRFTIPGNPIGKPRMTQRDKWAKRPAVLRWIAWKDAARPYVPALPAWPQMLEIRCFLAMPGSWSQRKKDKMRGGPHKQKPDLDNLHKCAQDFLFSDDSVIWKTAGEKRWDDGNGPRLEITVR